MYYLQLYLFNNSRTTEGFLQPSLRRKLPYPLLFTPLANEDLSVLFAHDVAVEALEDDLVEVFSVNDAVMALIKPDLANHAFSVRIFLQLIMQ